MQPDELEQQKPNLVESPDGITITDETQQDQQGSDATTAGGQAAAGKTNAPTFVANTVDLEKREEEEKIPFSKILKLYVIPIATVVGFTAVIVFLVVPAINNMFASLDKIAVLGEEVSDLDDDLQDLQELQLDIQQVNSDLSAINTIVSTGNTEVTAFQQKIISLAQENSLEVTEADTVEQILQTGDRDVLALGIIEIPNEFSIQGSLSGIQSFIAALQDVNDFIIVGEMDLRALPNEADIWSLNILLIKYQFQTPDENNNLAEVFLRVPTTAKEDPEVLDIIRR